MEGRGELLEHLQTPAAWGGHEFGDWPLDHIASGFGGDLDARHRHDHSRLTDQFGHTHHDLQRDIVRLQELKALGLRDAAMDEGTDTDFDDGPNDGPDRDDSGDEPDPSAQ